MIFLTLLFFPILIAGAAFVILHTVSWKEFLVQCVAQVVVAAACAGAVSCGATGDNETRSGVVTGKKQTWTSCEHSYRCRCRNVRSCSGSRKNRSCTTSEVCDTCYEHSNDWDWNVYSTIGTYDIDRVDRRGINEPPRWSQVRVRDPVADTFGYTNYVKAAPDSLFQHHGLVEKFAGQLPDYPQRRYDYYRMDRLVRVGAVDVQDAADWNADLMRINSDLGARKQVNAVIVLARSKPRDWYWALGQHWIGGKKNDVILVVSVGADLRAEWVEVMAWTTDKMLEVKLRDAILDLPKIERTLVIPALSRNIEKYYRRKPMADFEYLEASITPSTTGWVVTMLIGLIVAGGLAYFFHKEDVFGDGH